MNKSLPVMALALTTLLSTTHLQAAQRQSAERRMRLPQQRERVEREIQARFDQWIMDALKLDAQEAVEIRSVFEGYREDRFALSKREERMQQSVRSCIPPKEDRSWDRVNMGWEGGAMCGGDPQDIIQQMIDLRREETLLFEREFTSLMEIIDHRQLLLLIAMREEFKSHADRIRSRESRGRERAKRGPGGNEH